MHTNVGREPLNKQLAEKRTTLCQSLSLRSCCIHRRSCIGLRSPSSSMLISCCSFRCSKATVCLISWASECRMGGRLEVSGVCHVLPWLILDWVIMESVYYLHSLVQCYSHLTLLAARMDHDRSRTLSRMLATQMDHDWSRTWYRARSRASICCVC